MKLNQLKYKGPIGYFLFQFLYKIIRWFKYDRISDEKFVKSRFLNAQGYELNLDSPQTLNEKINWLKLKFSHPNESILADKFLVRKFIAEKIGEEYLIPLILETSDVSDITPEKLPDYPFIVKANHDSGSYSIIKDKNVVDWNKLRIDCKFWISRNYYWIEREKQYKFIKPRIIVEKLLISKEGKIPFDYKLHCINSKVVFIYVSVDREGSNKRNIYSRSWEPMHFTWAAKGKKTEGLRGEEIAKPSSIDKMIELAEKLSFGFPYVRIDFYDLDGKVYFGEVTQHHGGGFDQIRPIEWDYKLGELVKLK